MKRVAGERVEVDESVSEFESLKMELLRQAGCGLAERRWSRSTPKQTRASLLASAQTDLLRRMQERTYWAGKRMTSIPWPARRRASDASSRRRP